MRATPSRHTNPASVTPVPQWDLRLYVADETPLSLLAVENVKQVCTRHLAGRYRLKVIDVARSPRLVREDNIIVTPALVRSQPGLGRKLIGSMADTGRVLAWLGVLNLPLTPALPQTHATHPTHARAS